MPFHYVALVRPSRAEIHEAASYNSIDDRFLDHLQQTELSPGVAESEDGEQIHVRINVPFMSDKNELAWDRIDVVCGTDFVTVVQPRNLRLVERAVSNARHDAPTPSDFLSDLIGQLVETFHQVLTSLERGRPERRSSPRNGSRGTRNDRQFDQQNMLRELDRATIRVRNLIEELVSGSIEFVSRSSRNKLRVALDRLDTVEEEIARTRQNDGLQSRDAEDHESALGAESPEVIEAATSVGERRLRRLNLAHAITALIGAFGVSFGALALAWSGGPWMDRVGFERAQWIGAFFFPIGFVITLVGKGELFTENFFLPVTGVIRGRGTIRELLELWGYVLFFNVAGGIVAAFLMSRSGVMNQSASAFMIHLASDKIGYGFWEAFMKAVFAGWLMTIMTWLIIAATGLGTRIVIIWMIGFLIVAAHFNHVVISVPEIFSAMWMGAPITVGDWFIDNFIPALLGNLIGGVVFVTMLGILQARTLEQSDQESDIVDVPGPRDGFWFEGNTD